MAQNSKIEWTDHTFNPWRGCTKVSPGCANCYAETLSGRNPAVLGEWGPRGSRVIAAENYWLQPLKWNKQAEQEGVRRRVFCASLADVFEGEETMPERSWEAVQETRWRLFGVIQNTPHLDWLLLTKRPENILPILRSLPLAKSNPGGASLADCMPFLNVWLGTSVEDQQRANERIPHLLRCPAAVRFLSCEPLLGAIDLRQYWRDHPTPNQPAPGFGESDCWDTWLDGGIDWVICGGESGSKARPMHPDWARSLRDQCVEAGVPFFFKQWGEWFPCEVVDAQMWGGRMFITPDGQRHSPIIRLPGKSGTFRNGETRLMRPGEQTQMTFMHSEDLVSVKVGKHAAGRLLDGRTWDEFPEVS